MNKHILVGVGVVVVVVLGSFLFFQAAIAPTLGENEPTAIVGGDRDEHGCIGSAGYSWCEVKGRCLREWEEPCNTTNPTVFDVTVLVEGKAVQLQDGKAQVETVPGSASVDMYRIFGEPVYGDVSGDGVMDAVYYLVKETGGSGMFFYAVFTVGSESGYMSKEAVFLGDRIAPQNIYIEDGLAVANFADRKPGESFAVQPSIGKSVWLRYDATTDTVGEAVRNFEGEADPTRMTLMMKTWEWIQTKDEGGVTTPQKTGVFTLAFADEGTVAIGTDCNSMSDTYERISGGGGEKQSLTFGPIASTMMYCEGSQEQEFSSMLTKTNAYSFTARGELLLYQGEGSVATFR